MVTPDEILSQRPKLLIVTGEMGAGKTTWVRHFIDYARTQHAEVRGLFSPAIFENGVKTGIGLVNLATGEQRQLARQRTDAPDNTAQIVTKCWQFDPDVLAWGDAVLRAIIHTNILVIDEIGPLELERGAGWQSALALLDADQQYSTACVVIRPNLVTTALSRWPHAFISTIP
jgi:nucleoside-triphosphatase THEP1